MNFLGKISETIFNCIFATVGRQVSYLIHYKSNVDRLKTQVIDLRDAKDRVQNEVAAARWNVMEIEADVQTWLTRSDAIVAEAEGFFENNGQAKMKCFNGCCPNLKSHYRVSKEACKLELEVKEIQDKGKFDRVGYRQVVGTVTSNRGYEAFISRMPTLTGVLEALKDPKINKIGVYGMGGIGKTMLVKEIVEQASKAKLFDKYPFVIVSHDPDLKKIQREIADQLDLNLDMDSEFVRADLLCKRLKQEKILIVMDDIWKPLDLEAIGISFGDDEKGCKLLLTSRLIDVLHNEMDTQKEFLVRVLSDNEAINLFEKIVKDLAKATEIQPIAVQIIKECAGLPIAITTIANTLKNQTNINVWKDALKQLKMSSPTEIRGMHEKVYTSIKLSYKFLESNEAKSLLLLCSLHGEDYSINVEDLLRYGVGLGLFHNVDTMEDARCRVHTLVERLKASCLLLDGNNSSTVKMHDIIRDVAINIAAEDKHMITIRSSIDLQERSKWKDSTAISLPYIDACELPKWLECSKLQLFLLFGQKNPLQITDSFFEELKELRVLKLPQMWSEKLPSSLSSLENLQTLSIEGKLEDVTIIAELKNLKALSLSLPNITELPKEFGQLTQLRLLDLEKCFELECIPPNVLSNLKRLEELYMARYVDWEVGVEVGRNTKVSELDHMSYLTTLHIHIPDPKILPKAWIFERLVRYRIVIGGDWYWCVEFETSRTLKLNITFQVDDGIKALLKICEALTLGFVKGVKSILYELDSDGFPCLKHLNIEENSEIQCIIKSVGVLSIAFPILESITLKNVSNLEQISYCQHSVESFRNLRLVMVNKCDKLKHVFSSSMVGCFSQLQEMVICHCRIMTAIVSKERNEEIEATDDSPINIIKFTKLRSLILRFLFQLKGFYPDVGSHVLFNEMVVFPDLEKMEINRMHNMEMIWHSQLISDSFCKLEEMKVSSCDNLTNIIPSNMSRRLQNLQHLEISDCHSVEHVFEIQETNVEETGDMAATELRRLVLHGLQKLKHVWSMDPQGLTFEKLHTVEIYGCRGLKSVFPTSVAKGLMQLEKLRIEDCEVEEIVAKGAETTTLFVFPLLTSLELRMLPELKSFYPGKHTSEWPMLKKLDIYNCYKLNTFGLNELSIQEKNGLSHHVIPIQQPFFFSEKDKFPNLEELKLDEGDSMYETYGGPSAQFCCNLKALNLNGNHDKLTSSLSVLVGSENFHPGGTFQNVEAPRLGVSDFRRLKNIVPFSSKSFHNLKHLKVEHSDVLISLLTPSTARTLVQLKDITIHECKRMAEIVANEGSEAGEEIAFNNLTSLRFHDVPSLTAFHLGNHTIKFPSLDIVIVENCPKFKILSSGISSTPKLTSICIDGEYIIKKEGDEDLKVTIKQYWEAKLKTRIAKVR